MAVFRVKKTKNYTVMSNTHLRDDKLTLKAKGLLSQILSLPEDWRYSIAGLTKLNSDGKDAVRSAIRELEKAGYIERRKIQDEHGHFLVEYTIYEIPPDSEVG